ncbi:triple tyrosine motif-containing protein [Flavobacteriaceae bacterium LMO-SS05]
MKAFQLFVLLLTSLISFSQELPPIEKFTTEDYIGDNQNWMISQAPNKFIYVANNRGLLEFNGSKWLTYNSPNNTIIRAVNVIGNKIYTACYEEFGYWKNNNMGILEYFSLVSKLDTQMLVDEQIWNIIEFNEWVLFQSSNNIYFYNTKTEKFEIISANNIIYKVFKVKNRIYYHVAKEGVYLIENGKSNLIITDSMIDSDRVINIFEQDDSLLVLTRNSGFYKFQNGRIANWQIPATAILNKTNAFSSIQLTDGSFVIGTISDGILFLDKKGDILYQITQKNGLGNNTVLSLFEDKDRNVWAGLDNGINYINVQSAINTFFDYEGVLGTVYATQIFNDFIYVGSNQGLFYRKLDAVHDPFKFIEGTAGQVWELYVYNNEDLFCGHHLGTFLIDQGKAKQISNTLGAWTFKPVPNSKNLLLQGNYNGLYVLEKNNGSWKVKNKVEGFNNSSRYLEIYKGNQVWVSHEYKGVFRLKLNDSLTKVTNIDMETNLSSGKNSSLIKYNDQIVYASEKGVFKYSDKSKTFELDSILSSMIDKDEYISGKLIVDRANKLWVFSKSKLSYIDNDDVTNKPKITTIPIPSGLRKGVSGFENISLIKKNHYIIGTVNGYITIDLSKIKKENDHFIYLNSVTFQDLEDKIVDLPINEQAHFNYKHGVLKFNYSVPQYDKYSDVKYQYQLDGRNNKWSNWTDTSEEKFENLAFGDYTFNVRAKVGNLLTKNFISYNFTINRPWYVSNTALIIYLLSFFGIVLITHKAYKQYYSKKLKHEQLENEQKIMQIKNEKLNQDIESKNRELAISTMSIIKRNEVLSSIKKELKKNKHITGRNPAIRLIDNNLNSASDWAFFEQAFNNADKDFLGKIKEFHPGLTPNDLRFCAYLRLNLSSKEIAPLLNISIKSVETKRYRLRKRLGLDHDESLVNYILKF